MTSEGTHRPQRVAAARNRSAILDAAGALLRASPTASMNQVAKDAGVGAGTLYRHFPSREALVLAVYEHDLAAHVASTGGRDEKLAIDRLAGWFRSLAEYVRVKHGLGEALHSPAFEAAVNDSYAPVTAAVARLLEDCVEEGSARPGLDPADVLLLMGFLWRVPATSEGAQQAERAMAIVLRGLG